MMEVWIGRDGERHGPYAEADIRQWLASGEVSPAELGWYEGLADWQPLSVLFPDAVASATAVAPATVPPPLVSAPSLHDYAGFWKRVAAFILDYVVLYFPGKLIGAMFGTGVAEAALQKAQLAAAGDPTRLFAAIDQYMHATWPAMLASSLMIWLYFALCESSAWQASLGKLALGIRVTDLHGQRISLPRALGRYPAKLLGFFLLYVGVLMVAWTQRKQGLHDLIAGTLVLNGRASGSHANPASSSAGNTFSA